MPQCSQCGLCCRLFLINLNKKEYLSGKYQTIFGKQGSFKSFAQAKKYGAIFLAQKKDGSCIYLKNNICSIHNHRPQACRGFFCTSKNPKYQQMIAKINAFRDGGCVLSPCHLEA